MSAAKLRPPQPTGLVFGDELLDLALEELEEALAEGARLIELALPEREAPGSTSL